MLKGFDNVSLSVKDVTRSVAFYRDVLGMRLADTYGDDTSFMAIDGVATTIMLEQREEPVAGTGYITLTVDDVRARKPEIEAKGGKISNGPFPIPGVGAGMMLQDPDGNRICLIDHTDTK